ncbi:MAG: TIGR01620 family protein [gamma proteobacterium symbiont of Bathyaustriella thionipta]|nr:TIGR01620 family protein [gamma proteobacterium symbiont of Bathyaustriella thionipta]
MSQPTPTEANHWFIPLQEEAVAEPLESLSDDDSDITSDTHTSFSLKPRRIAYLRPLLIGLLLLLFSMGGWEVYQTWLALQQWHWIAGSGFALLITGLLLLALKAWRDLRNNQQDLRSAIQLREEAARLQQEQSFAQSKPLLSRFEALYDNKPQAALLQKCLQNLPDYNDDREIIRHIDEGFLQQLDQAAMRCVRRYSQQTGILVGLSPLALADMLLALWRSTRMVDEISQIYGIRPSLSGRLRLGKEILQQMAFAGASEWLADYWLEATSRSLVDVVSAKLAQGIGAALYSARIGTRAMCLCRPIEFRPQERPAMRKMLGQIREGVSQGLSQKPD